jgi:hypothetical protein
MGILFIGIGYENSLLTTYRVRIMIAVKNSTTTIATIVMTTSRKAQGTDNFVAADQDFYPKISILLIFISNTIFGMVFLHNVLKQLFA